MTRRAGLSSIISIPFFILKDDPACAQTDPEMFFPMDIDMGGGRFSAKYLSIDAAKRVCKECPLIKDCLEYALKNHEIGIWGGTTEHERKLIKKRNSRRYSANSKVQI